MKITRVTTAVVAANYDYTYVRVFAGDAYGTGECFFAPGLSAIIAEMIPSLLGRDPRGKLELEILGAHMCARRQQLRLPSRRHERRPGGGRPSCRSRVDCRIRCRHRR